MDSASYHIFRYVAVIFIVVFLVPTQFVYAQEQETATLTGMVLDENNEPIQNAIIRVLGPGYVRGQATTDSSGSFQVVVDREGWYSVYAMCDRSETLGFDYVPSLWKTYLQLGSTAAFTFTLEGGASLYLDGELRFVESSKPADYARFTVTHPNGESLKGEYSVYTYGTDTDLVRRLGFNQKLVVIPANKEVAIRIDASISLPWISHTFLVKGKPGYFKLSQGETLHVASMEYTLGHNMANVKKTWDSALYLLKVVEHVGFLISAERQDLLDAYHLTDTSLVSMKKGLHYEAFAKLRNAYVLTKGTLEKLQDLIQISSLSALLLMTMFAFIASSCAYLITERESCVEIFSQGRKKISVSINLLLSIFFYSILVCTFYLAYPGCRLISRPVFLSATLSMLTVGQVAVTALPRALSEKKGEDSSIQLGSAFIIAFSMACRNLRRRKTRTILSLSNMMILVFGFITLTSISPSFGLATRSLPPSIPQHAILIRDRLEGSEEPFLPLPQSFLMWLENQPNITLVSPKAENIPARGYTWLYTRSGNKFLVRGTLGIAPSVESNFTHVDEVVISGEYLRDDDLRGILICSSLSKMLEVDVGDKLYGFDREFTIRGFFDKKAMETLKDVDGQFLIPRYVDALGIIPCRGDEVIIVTYNASFSLPEVVMSRVDVQLKDPTPKEYSEFAQMVVLSTEYRVFVSHPNSLHLQYLGSYIEEKGAGLIPFLMVLVMLNVSVMMLGLVSERKNEIASLSSVGLNPTHISALFIAEAAVIGFIGGGLGYLLGILGYRTALTTWFGVLQVREKASAEWGLIALLLSGFTAIIASAIPSLKASAIVTPSLLRKWSISREVEPRETGQPWVLDLPVSLRARELEPFTGFIHKRIRERTSGAIRYVTDVSLKEEETDKGPLKRLVFRYSRQSPPRWSRNELVVQRAEGRDYFEAKLLCIPSKNSGKIVRESATHVRKLIFEWNAMEFEVATPFDPSLSQLYTLVNAYNPTSVYIATTQPMADERMDSLKKRLIVEGVRPPRMVISRVDPLEMEQCMKTAEELVSRADVVCVSGEPDALCTALAINAMMQKKTICFVVDPRPMKVRMKDPFQTLKIVNIR
ncbi:MAG: FtsX-like permease family protein [Candidatus Bathyarchaeia archaeon]